MVKSLWRKWRHRRLPPRFGGGKRNQRDEEEDDDDDDDEATSFSRVSRPSSPPADLQALPSQTLGQNDEEEGSVTPPMATSSLIVAAKRHAIQTTLSKKQKRRRRFLSDQTNVWTEMTEWRSSSSSSSLTDENSENPSPPDALTQLLRSPPDHDRNSRMLRVLYGTEPPLAVSWSAQRHAPVKSCFATVAAKSVSRKVQFGDTLAAEYQREEPPTSALKPILHFAASSELKENDSEMEETKRNTAILQQWEDCFDDEEEDDDDFVITTKRERRESTLFSPKCQSLVQEEEGNDDESSRNHDSLQLWNLLVTTTTTTEEMLKYQPEMPWLHEQLDEALVSLNQLLMTGVSPKQLQQEEEDLQHQIRCMEAQLQLVQARCTYTESRLHYHASLSVQTLQPLVWNPDGTVTHPLLQLHLVHQTWHSSVLLEEPCDTLQEAVWRLSLLLGRNNYEQQ